jgi:hypothetical protein
MFDESAAGERVESGESSQRQEGEAETTPDLESETPGRPATEPEDADEETAGRRQPPREPTPEEIAFGTASEEDEAGTETTDEASTETNSTPGTDPLAEPEDE